MADQGGDWAWPKLSNAQAREVLTKLASFETLDQKSLHKVRHSHTFGSLPKLTQDRLRALEKDDAERYYSFHLSATARVWCVPYAGVMCVLWWDPDHKVYPAYKTHT